MPRVSDNAEGRAMAADTCDVIGKATEVVVNSLLLKTPSGPLAVASGTGAKAGELAHDGCETVRDAFNGREKNNNSSGGSHTRSGNHERINKNPM